MGSSTWVDIVVVAIGETEDDVNEWLHNVTCLDVADDEKDIFVVTEFTDAGFRELEALIRNKTCTGTNVAIDSYLGEQWTYDDGSTSLGNVPTASGDGSAPVDPDAFSFGTAMESLLSNQQQQAMEQDEASVAGVSQFQDVEITLSPFALINLWAMAILALCVNAVLIIRCMMQRKRYVAEHDMMQSDDMGQDEVDF